ncbi:cation-translocating P-type ATPase [Aquincola sp. S2]|uniref:Cation-translocating P-type ATPase n=1 Tax=Pseudaquabacterium terrae TaxID=2732868 RepID=A0ABX2ER10_9BURK|nr:cation-translocating P-type ATPase [Aquabacterium terrae]NRF70960.1 cation-translocating P-type ATPase [Aquabacterium terrae]
MSTLAWDDPTQLARFTRWSGADAARRADSTLLIDGMVCAACSVLIEDALKRLPGVESADVNPATRRAQLRWDPARTRASALVAAIEGAGDYRALPAHALDAETARRREWRAMLWRLFVAGFCMMQVMMYATPAYVAGPEGISPDIARLLQWASWLLSIPVLLFSAAPFLRGAINQLTRRRIGMDVPVALGIVVTFAASTAAAFDPGGVLGSEVYFDSLTMFVFFLLAGRALELRARHASVGQLEDLMARLPETVERIAPDGRGEMIALTALVHGDTVRVRPGQAFPGDGPLVDGSTLVDEALLTGESTPLRRNAGDGLLAGSFNVSAPVLQRLQTLGEDTRYARIVALMARAAADRPPLARAADRIALPFLWGVLLLACGGALAWWWIDPARSVWVAVSVLIVTCPCALSLATPSALLTAAGTLARRGVLVQRLAALEALARADLIVFDKTGTLTEDRIALKQVLPAPGWRADTALQAALTLANGSLHPVSRAIVDAANRDGIEPSPLSDQHETAGQGVQGRDARGRCWRLGAQAFAGTGASADDDDDDDHGAAWLSVDGEAVARLQFEERLRPDARAALERLHADGVRTMLLSGDRPAAAQRVASALGVREVHAGASPEDKLRIVAAAQGQGHRVAMVGDGINDGPVLARADVSLAMGQGAPLARAQADFTLLRGSLVDLVATRALAQRTLRVLRQNLGWAAAYNAVCVPLALAGWLPPWAAGLGMACSSLSVVLNAQRLRRIG